MRRRPWGAGGSACALLSLFAGSLLGQATSGTILGTVHDPSGAAVAGAKVTITDTAKGTTTEAQTSDQGDYSVPFLIPDPYTVSIEKEGFRRAVSQQIVLNVDQRQRVDVSLEVGQVSQTLEVTAAAPLVRADSAELGEVISQQSVQQLPLNGRNFAQLVTLVPGVTPGQSGENLSGASTFNPRASSNFNALGSQANANAWLVDGIVDNEYTFNTVMVQPSVESVLEFKVLTGSYSAEFGRGAGIVTTQTRSGSNQFHGSLFEFLRNSYMDARAYNNAKPQAQTPYKRNQFGASIGGPVIKNKTFFFADFFGWREIKGQTFVDTVPTALEHSGNFSELCTQAGGSFDGGGVCSAASGRIYDPTTGQPFANNIIPTNRINPVAANVMSLYPLPNTGGSNPLINNYTASLSRDLDDKGGNARIDHRFGDKDSMFGRFSFEQFTLFDTKGQSGCCIPTPASVASTFDLGPYVSGGQNTTLAASGFAFNETHIFTPTVVNEFIAGFARTNPRTTQSDYGHEAATSLGIAGINLNTATSGLPGFTITNSGYGSLTGINGGPAFLPANPRQTSYQLQDNISVTRGTHALKFGYRVVRDDVSPYTNPNNGTRSALNFNNNLTGTPNGGGNGVATMLLGYLANGTSPAATRGFLIGVPYLRAWEHSAFVEDDWKVRPGFTLNLGLRWDMFTPYTEKYNRLSNFDPTTLNMLYAKQNSDAAVGVETRANNFGPHVGFAWDATGNGKTVLRGGFTMSYFPEGTSASNMLVQNVPWAIVQNSAVPSVIYGSQLPDLSLYPTINNPLPAAVPVQPTNATQIDPSKGVPTLIGLSRDNQTPYYETWDFNIERQLASNTLLEVAYAGSRGVHLMYCYNPQEVQPGTGSSNSRLTIPAIPLVRSITQCDPRNSSNYHGLQVKLNRRMSNGLQLLGSYTWSKSLDYGGTAASGGGASGNPQTITNLKAGYGPSGFDVEHRFVGSWIYELPFGKGKPWLQSGVLSLVLGNWQTGGIATIQTGTPFTVTISGSCPNGASSCWPDLVKADTSPAHRDYSHWFDPTAFLEPCAALAANGTCSTPALRYGNEGRGILRNPGLFNFDLFAQKNLVVKERFTTTLRLEAFNALNHPILGFTGTVGINGANPAASSIALVNPTGDNRDLEAAIRVTF